MTQKIATCCYCGARAALIMDKARHELVCGSCGAPLQNIKKLDDRPHKVKKSKKSKQEAAFGVGGDMRSARRDEPKRKGKKKKKPKSLGRSFFKEAFDFIEDIID
ncbi:MAG: hypothetical protein ACRBB0_20225 [Pelagimonas sp.]|uniref:hypothetical protein n=1 Tax=Pelagimonas sp. TaxID=2073170 RepID=UPI003D6A0923